jgi:drug/metabolite transporter (DMT)-like permease
MKIVYLWICILTTVLAAAAGDVLLAFAMRRIGDIGELRRTRGFLAVVARLVSSRALFAGIFFMAIAFFSNLVGLSWGDLSIVGPGSAALTFVANALAAKFFLRENVDRRRWLATFFVCCGVFLLTRS